MKTKRFIVTVQDIFAYGGCLMKVDDEKLSIKYFRKKWIIKFEDIKGIVVYRFLIGIEYMCRNSTEYIKINL